MRECPLAALDFLGFRHAELEQMPDGGRKNVLVALVVVVVAREAAERTRDIRGNGGLFSDDQALRHDNFSKKRTPILPKVRDLRQEIVRMNSANARPRSRVMRVCVRWGRARPVASVRRGVVPSTPRARETSG